MCIVDKEMAGRLTNLKLNLERVMIFLIYRYVQHTNMIENVMIVQYSQTKALFLFCLFV